MQSLVKLIRQTYHMVQPHEGRLVMNNVAALSALQIINYLLPLLIIPYLFRVLGPDKFGLIAFAQAFVQYFLILTNYGFNVSATKEISLCRDDHLKISRIFSAVMIVKIALAFLSLLLLSVLLAFIPKFRSDWLVYALSFGAVVGSTLFPVWFFQGMEKMNYITNLNIVIGSVSALFLFCLVKGPRDYLMVPLINSSAVIIIGLLGQIIVFRRFNLSVQFPRNKNIRKQIKAGWDIFLSVAAINAYTTTRIFILGLLTNNKITGFFSIAERIANACQTFPLDSFSQAIFPRLSKIYKRNKLKALKITQRIQQITVLISLIFLPSVFILAEEIVTLVCGGIYPETVLTLRLLLVAVFFVSANAFRVQFLLVCGQTRMYSRIHLTMAMVGMPLILLLVDSFSYTGAAIATVVVEAGVFAMTYFTVKKLSLT